jgi:hypothetical protein
MLSTHYADLYRLAAFASQAMDAGLTKESALASLVEALQELYANGQEVDRDKITSFLTSSLSPALCAGE